MRKANASLIRIRMRSLFEGTEFPLGLRLTLWAPTVMAVTAWVLGILGGGYFIGVFGGYLIIATVLAGLVELVAIPYALRTMRRDPEFRISGNYVSIAVGAVPVVAAAFFVSACVWSLGDRPTALHTAAENNDVAVIKEWIARGKNLDRGMRYGTTLEASGYRGVTALMLAAQRGNEEAAAALIQGGANIYLEEENLGPATGVVVYNRTALDYAVEGGSRRILTMLADRWKGKPLTRRGQQDLFLAWENMCNGPYLARHTAPYADGKWVAGFVLDRLLTKEESQRALLQASRQAGCPDQISFLLDRHVSPTPEMLIGAIRRNRADLVKELLAAGADANAPMVIHWAPGVTPAETTTTPLDAAAWSVSIIQILLDAGADVNAQNEEGGTALHYAVEGDWREGVNGYTPTSSRMDAIEFLISHGARTDLRDTKGKVPGDYLDPSSRRSLGRLRSRMLAALDLPGDEFPRAVGDRSAIARVCVDSKGNLTASPEIVESSGVPKWDSAAVELLSRGATRLRATGDTRRGSCVKIAIDFPPRSTSNGTFGVAGDLHNCAPPLVGAACNRPPPTPVYACVTSHSYEEVQALKGLRCN